MRLNLDLAGREPALLCALINIGAKLLGVWLGFDIDEQALLNAVTSAGFGVLVAMSTRDGQGAALLGFAQALLALVIGLGLKVDAEMQALIMSAVALAVGMYNRTQVTAPVPPPTR